MIKTESEECSMPARIAINGFGRIGRLVFRILSECEEFEVVAINDLVPVDNLAYLLKFDTAHGRFKGDVKVEDNNLIVNGKKVEVFSEKDPSKLPWKSLDVAYVVESTGLFTAREGAEKHIAAGAARVLITAPAKGEVPTFVMGVNHHKYDPEKDVIVSNASCTTNCLAPLAKVLLDTFGIEEGLMTTVHAATASQPTVDGPSQKDWRGGRAAGQNIIPASTGAAKAVALCIPEVEGKLTGMAFRVPIIDVSVVDLTVRLSKPASLETICEAVKKASENEMKGIIDLTEELVVSSDFIGSSLSSILDVKASIGLSDTFFKLISWYDNEMGYASRIVDLLKHMASRETSEVLVKQST